MEVNYKNGLLDGDWFIYNSGTGRSEIAHYKNEKHIDNSYK